MKKETVAFMLGLILLIPMTTKLAFGFLLAIEFFLLFFATIMSTYIIDLLALKSFVRTFYYASVITVAIFYMLVLKILSPMIYLEIGVYVYIPVFSYILSFSIFQYDNDFENIMPAGVYSGLLLVLSLIRELCAFGTLSFPSISGVVYVHILPLGVESPLRFFGTGAGAFILLGLGMWLYMCMQKSTLLPLRGDQQ